ncbi:hypothetical protein ACFL08_02705 [Patescibacteria group bacterium]
MRPRKKIERNTKELNKIISEILVVNDKDLSPYIEILNFSPENITQKSLGTLLGCFEIKDDSDDSAYIVNFLSSVAKKEYFLNPKRPASKSFESALHKVNLALSEIANHNNISWIGKIDAALCVIEKYSIHFSVTGAAKILLIRDGEILEISEGLASDEGAANPIKTFTDISSGKLKDNDKIIITSEDIFHVLSFDEIKRTSSKFSNEKFVRFLNTALVNELSIAGTIVIDVKEEALTRPITRLKPSTQVETPQIIENAFSGKIFEEKSSQKKTITLPKKVLKEKPIAEPPKDYTDKKTGHIYLKDDTRIAHNQSDFIETLLVITKEKLLDLQYWYKNNIKGKWYIHLKKMVDSKKIKALGLKITAAIQNQIQPDHETPTPIKKDLKVKHKIPSPKETPSASIKELPTIEKLTNFLPSFSRIKDIFSNLTQQQKLSAIILIIAIIFVPIIIGKITSSQKEAQKDASLSETIIPEKNPEEILSGEKNIIFTQGSEKIYSDKNILGVKNIDKNLFAIKDSSILVFTNDKLTNEFDFPAEFSKSRLFTFMDKLNLFFILTETNQVLGFNAVSKSFQHYSIELPENSNIQDMGSFLYYIYLADTNSGQIYRYPKGTGRFEEKTDWLTEKISFSNLKDIEVNAKILLTKEENPPLSFFKGKKDPLIFENSKTPISYDLMRSTDGMENIFVLDRKNSRIIKFSEEGGLLGQYYNEKIKDAFDFTLTSDEIIYLNTLDGIHKIQLKN